MSKSPRTVLSILAAGSLCACGMDEEPASTVQTTGAASTVTFDFDDGRAVNPIHQLAATIDPDGLTVETSPGRQFLIRFSAFGRDGSLAPVNRVAPRVDGDSAIWDRLPGLEEWWTNNSLGFEQGFELAQPPSGTGPLVFDLAVEGAAVQNTERGLFIIHDDLYLGFEQLFAIDADGKALMATMTKTDAGFEIRVEDQGATYPISVDPTLGYYTYAVFPITSLSGKASAIRGSFYAVAEGTGPNESIRLMVRNGDDLITAQILPEPSNPRSSQIAFGTHLLFSEDGTTLVVAESGLLLAGTSRMYGGLRIYRLDENDQFTFRTERIFTRGLPRGPPFARGFVEALALGPSLPNGNYLVYVGLPTDTNDLYQAGFPVFTLIKARPRPSSGTVIALEMSPEGDIVATTTLFPAVSDFLRFGQALSPPWVGSEGRVDQIVLGTDNIPVVSTSRSYAPDNGVADCFGRSVGAGVYVILVGAPCARDGQGEVRQYLIHATAGSGPRRTLVQADGLPGDGFGHAIAVEESIPTTFLIGEPGRDVDGVEDAGRVNLRHETNTYGGPNSPASGSFTALVPTPNGRFGQTLSLGALEATVSVPQDDPRRRVRQTGMTGLVGASDAQLIVDIDRIAISNR